MKSKLKDKVAIVTGGASGIGKAIVREFAREGAKVVVADIDFSEAKKTASQVVQSGGESLPVKVDVSSRKEVKEMVKKVVEKFSRIDILVNNAGISVIVPFLEMTDETWEKTLNINLAGTFLCCQEVLPYLLKQKNGKIINMSSQSGKQANSWYAAYCASKFGIIGLTQSLALEFAPSGININAICPGVVFTPMWDSQMEPYAKKYNLKPTEVKNYLINKIPLGRLATPEDVAQVAVFLASADSDYLTGQALNVSGGAILG
ncbi:MAG: SDR family NAD(P)-dependent oxidoreductase [Candidatus Omnitrophota bacterium]